jgi:hypothetical protein
VTVPKEGEEDDEKYIHVFEGKVLQLVEDPKSCPDVTIGKIKFKATAQNHPMALVQWDDVFGCHDSWVPLDLGKYLAEKKRYGWTLLKPDYVRYCDELRRQADEAEAGAEPGAKRRRVADAAE